MPLEIVTVPCLSDNYAYLVHGPEGTDIVDAPDAAPLIAALEARGWKPGRLLITHHHADHVQGIPALRERYPDIEVIGPKAEAGKIGTLDSLVEEGDSVGSGEMRYEVMAVPGHTLGHIAFYLPAAGAAFTADSLMALGCGRVFEGTMPMMHESLQKLAALPEATMIYSGHEYTTGNARFALSVDPDNPALQARARSVAAAREAGKPTVPVSLAEELATNPFLRAGDPAIRALLGMESAADADVFGEIRGRKDRF